MDVVKGANLGLAFLLELCMLAAFGYWGWQTGDNLPAKLGLGIGTPLLVAVFWGLFMAPKATWPLGQPWHLLLQVLLFGAAAVALYTAGRPTLAWIFALAFVVNTVLVAIWRQ
jgi:hypothetical protein